MALASVPAAAQPAQASVALEAAEQLAGRSENSARGRSSHSNHGRLLSGPADAITSIAKYTILLASCIWAASGMHRVR
jgi:hypothetical protein